MRKFCTLVEDLGYHGIPVIEHHFQGDRFVPSPLLRLSQASALTRRVRLVTNILVSTLCNPVHLLEDLATLDNLSEGRLTFGTSPGYSSEEFAGRGVSYPDRFKRHENIIDFIQQAWANPSDISFEGRFFTVPALALSPVPVQKTLPLWYGVSGPKLLEHAARRRAPLVASPRHTVAELKELYRRYMAVAERIGFTPVERPIFHDGLVLDTVAEAERHGVPGTDGLFCICGRKSAERQRPLHTDGGDLVTATDMVRFRALASRYIVGDPALARDRIAELKRELDPSEVVLRMQMPGVPTERLAHSLRLFAEEVMPAFA